MKKIHVSTGKPYDIIIERGVLDSVGEYASKLCTAGKACVISDTNVAPLYLDRVVKSMEGAGIKTVSHVFEAGEKSKHLTTISEIYATLADFRMTRKDVIVALGGGVCGDMAGFAAASYLRGIDFIQIPTSLLAQVDSSVGGKTGVDLPQGKNLVGAFHQPLTVLIDPDTLDTLPNEFRIDGMGEVIKYGCIKDERLFETLENENALDIIEDIIEICVSIKRDVVNRDEKESGERMLLNFGHTLGHSLEKLYNFEGLSHGEAVAIGMVKIAASGENAGLTEAGTADRIERLCKKNMLPTSDEASAATLAELCQSDKKAGGGSVNLVLLDKIGSSFIRKTPLSELEAFIR